ncbi:MAG: hypothetical protein R2699_09710 [Acidimicrobiales bacterium]|nr:hypothetical protein [Acidimicrobiales bacterium]
MSPRTVRFAVIGVCVVGIAGMIVGSIRDSNGMAVTFGLATAVAVLFLIVLTAVVGPDAFRRGADDSAPPARADDAVAADVEARIEALAAEGTDETALRKLVARAVELGRSER